MRGFGVVIDFCILACLGLLDFCRLPTVMINLFVHDTMYFLYVDTKKRLLHICLQVFHLKLIKDAPKI